MFHDLISRRVVLRTGDEERGTLLLDSLVAISILSAVFSVVAPAYARGQLQAQVTTDKEQLANIGTALQLAANDNGGVFPGTAGSATPISATFPGAVYLPVAPASALDPTKSFSYTLQTDGSYVVSDGYTFADTTLIAGLHKADGTPCAAACTTINYSNTQGIYGS